MEEVKNIGIRLDFKSITWYLLARKKLTARYQTRLTEAKKLPPSAIFIAAVSQAKISEKVTTSQLSDVYCQLY
jgi:hypothetical protein